MMDEVKMTLSIKSSSKLLSDAHAAPSDRRAQRLPLAWRLSKSAEVASWDNCCDDVGNKYSGQLGPAVSRQTATSLQGGKFCGVWAQYETEQGGEKKKRSRFVVVVLLSSPLAAVHLVVVQCTLLLLLSSHVGKCSWKLAV